MLALCRGGKKLGGARVFYCLDNSLSQRMSHSSVHTAMMMILNWWWDDYSVDLQHGVQLSHSSVHTTNMMVMITMTNTGQGFQFCYWHLQCTKREGSWKKSFFCGPLRNNYKHYYFRTPCAQRKRHKWSWKLKMDFLFAQRHHHERALLHWFDEIIKWTHHQIKNE